MVKKSDTAWASSKEVIFQIVLHLLVLVFYSIDRREPEITVQEIAFYLNYVFFTFFISFYLLPKFYYKKKYLQFSIGVLLAVTLVILVEEMFLESIFYPDTRGKVFGGLFNTLAQVLPVMAILSGFKFAWDASGKQREVDQLKLAVQESELQFLKTQINPHFLFNNLNNLYSYAIENSPKTPDIILELSGVLRYMLYECREKYVLLTKEVEQMENYVKLSEMQIEERGTVNFSSKNIQPNFKIAPLILMVFIENAFKHSTASQSENISIDISLELSDNGKLNFNCKNSFQPQSNTDNIANGIGLENVKKRLKLLYPDAHKLDIQKNQTHYKVNLKLDLNQSN